MLLLQVWVGGPEDHGVGEEDDSAELGPHDDAGSLGLKTVLLSINLEGKGDYVYNLSTVDIVMRCQMFSKFVVFGCMDESLLL